MTQNTHFSTSVFLRALLSEDVDELLKEIAGHKNSVARIEQVRLMLEALPLGSTEYGLAVNRLANAQHYLETGEFGAAGYELRLLGKSLKN